MNVWTKNTGKHKILKFEREGDHPLFGAWMGFRDRTAQDPDHPWRTDIDLFAKEIPSYPTDGKVYKLVQTVKGRGYNSDNVKWEVAYVGRTK